MGSAGGMLMRSHLPQIGEELAVLKAGCVVDYSFGSVVSQSSSEVVTGGKVEVDMTGSAVGSGFAVTRGVVEASGIYEKLLTYDAAERSSDAVYSLTRGVASSCNRKMSIIWSRAIICCIRRPKNVGDVSYRTKR